MVFTQCDQPKNVNKGADSIDVIPLPKKITNNKGEFIFTRNTKILVYPGNEEMLSIGEYFADIINSASGLNIEVSATKKKKPPRKGILLSLEENPDMNAEGYHLLIDPGYIIINGKTPNGLFYGIQTLRQMLPPEIELEEVIKGIKWTAPAVEIEDEPMYSYRGLMLDVGRHFFPKEDVKRFIDIMALHKFNYFHWHLTEDQGWRIEIKKYPELTEIGAFRKETLVGHYRDKPRQFDGEKYGGFYTQDDIKEVVEYAASRYITIVPEIEMPGHSEAALASLSELGCTGGPYEVFTKWGINNEVYCAGNEKTFEFLENVLAEVIELFPGKYIHIGGDECPKERWKECDKCQARMKEEGLENEHELQSYFIGRIEKFLLANNRKLIGWDEILEGGLAPEATVMSWRGTKGGIEAAKQHHDVIMTPTTHCYFDYYQSENKENEPLAIGGYLPLEKVYSYDPMPEELSEEEAKYILGAQGNLWTEYIKTPDKVEYMTYPRATALSEVVWTQPEKKDYGSFLKRMEKHYKRFANMGVNSRITKE
ncbi:MAG: beta-N-acetylhexosaminidase [Bacteroidales bacterium]|nr:beta-N-acetylhexosaminidase [Bacteroidales bacterium]